MRTHIILSMLALIFISGCSDAGIPQTYSPPAQERIAPVEGRAETPVDTTRIRELLENTTEVKQEKEADVPLSNDNYYINSRGNKVHSPAYAPSRPAGASARCRDGTYSFSQSRRGTCSHHGGVAEWY